MDPAKTTRVPNMTLKAFQKNAVQSYFERQQQQQQQISPIKETGSSQQIAKLRSSHMVNGTNGNIKYDRNSNGLNLNGASVIRPQSLPMNKISVSMESIPQTRLSLPNKLSQIINLTTQLAAQKQHAANSNTNLLERQNDRIKAPTLKSPVNSPIKSSTNQTSSPMDKNQLQSINESGVPPPPPRRTNRDLMPVRR